MWFLPLQRLCIYYKSEGDWFLTKWSFGSLLKWWTTIALANHAAFFSPAELSEELHIHSAQSLLQNFKVTINKIKAKHWCLLCILLLIELLVSRWCPWFQYIPWIVSFYCMWWWILAWVKPWEESPDRLVVVQVLSYSCWEWGIWHFPKKSREDKARWLLHVALAGVLAAFSPVSAKSPKLQTAFLQHSFPSFPPSLSPLAFAKVAQHWWSKSVSSCWEFTYPMELYIFKIVSLIPA